MKRIMFGYVWCLVMATATMNLFAQGNSTGNRPSLGPGADPRVRRSYREKAVATVGGPNARDFVEAHGDEAVAAIFACSKPVAVKLAEFHASGELAKLPRPRDLLFLIAQRGHGDDVAVWAINHSRELCDTDSFDAFLQSPLQYALGLKQIEAGAAEARALRLNPPPPPPMVWPTTTGEEKLAIGICIGIVVLLGVGLWRRRQSSIC